jgi:hypothetical protein
MKRKPLEGAKGIIRTIEAFAEMAVLAFLYYYFWRNMYSEGIFPTYYGNGKYVLTGVYGLLVMVMFRSFDGFGFGFLRLSEIIVSQGIAIVIANFITFWQIIRQHYFYISNTFTL